MYTVMFIVALTLLSGFADSLGFVHASRIWAQGKLAGAELLKSGIGFGIGIGAFWIAIRYMRDVGIVTAEMQTTLWFAAAIVGVAIVSGQFLQWKPVEQLVAFGVIAGIGWLLVKTSA